MSILLQCLWILALCALLSAPSIAAPGEKFESSWREFRLAPFEVFAEKDSDDLRAFLGDLFQYRRLLHTALPGTDVHANWPIRIWVRSVNSGSSVARLSPDAPLPILVDRYVVVLGQKPQLDAGLKLAIARTIIQDSMRPMPAWFDEGFLRLLAGADIQGQVIRIGMPPLGMKLDHNIAKVNWLLMQKESMPALSVLAGNLEKGMDPRTALRNSYQSDFARLERESKSLVDSGSPLGTVVVSGLANNPRKDFRDWFVPLGYSNLAALADTALSGDDTRLARELLATRSAMNDMDARARSQYLALSAFVAARSGQKAEAASILKDLTSNAITESAWVYLESALLASSNAERTRLAAIAKEKNAAWPEVYRFQATLIDDPSASAKLLLEAAKRSPRDVKAWEMAADALASARDYALADTALEGASRAARTPEEQQRFSDARWAMREDRARKDEEDRQKVLEAERLDMEKLRAKTLARIEEALEKANRANASSGPPPAEVIKYQDLDKQKTTEGNLVRIICRSDESFLLEVRTPAGSDKLVLNNPEKVVSESGKPWEFRCGAQSGRERVRVSYLPKRDRVTGTIGEVLALDAIAPLPE